MTNQKKGIALLMAVYISSAAIMLGLGVLMLLFGELGLTGSAKGSAVAFYGADTGIECGLYYDMRQNAFSTTTPITPINCNGGLRSVAFTRIDTNGDGLQNGGNFTFDFSVPSNACVKVTVQKLESGQTVIDSFGQNVSDCAIVSQKSAQRGLEVSY